MGEMGDEGLKGEDSVLGNTSMTGVLGGPVIGVVG